MIWLWILGILAALILLLCLTRVGARAELRRDGVTLDAKIGPFHIRILPAKETPEKKKKPEKKAKKPEKAGEEKPKKSLPKIALADIKDAVHTLAPPLKRALGRTRRGRSSLLAVGLLPGCLQQAASFSPDALVLGLAFAFAAHCLGMVWADGPVRPAEAVPLLVLAAALGPAQAVYVLLVGLVLLVPTRRFAGLPRWAEPGLKRGVAAAALAGWSIYNLEYVRYILRDVNEIAVFGLAAAAILLLLSARPAWNWWKSRPARTRRALAAGAVLLLAAAAFAALKALHLGGDLTPEQLAEGMQPNGDSIYTWSVGYTLRHLPALAKLLVGTLCAKLPQLLQEMMGACPGEPIVYGAELSWAITIGLLFTTLLAACRPVGTPARLERGTRLVPALALLGVCGLLVLACLTWTPVNYTILFGLQGRYFLPVLPLALLLWGENRWLGLGRDLTRPLALAQAALCGLAALQTMALFAAR